MLRLWLHIDRIADTVFFLLTYFNPVDIPLQGPTPEERQFQRDIELYDTNSYKTNRAVTPILPAFGKTSCLKVGLSQVHPEFMFGLNKEQPSELFSPMSTKFLVPSEYEAVFTGHQTLRVSEFSQPSLKDLSPVSPVFSDSILALNVTDATTKGEFDNAEALSQFEKTISEFKSENPNVISKKLSKRLESPQQSDSDVEFFECRQAFSDSSETEEVKLEHEITHHISKTPSPMPGCSPGYRRFSFSSESLSEFAFNSEDSQGIQKEGNLPLCEELPSRDQAGYYDDDDFVGRVRVCVEHEQSAALAFFLPGHTCCCGAAVKSRKINCSNWYLIRVMSAFVCMTFLNFQRKQKISNAMILFSK